MLLYLFEETTLFVLMMCWVIVLPPGSLYFQAMCRMLGVLIFSAGLAVFVSSFDFFRVTGRPVILGVMAGLLVRILLPGKETGRQFSAAMLPAVRQCETYFTAVMQQWVSETPVAVNNASLEGLWQGLPRWVNAGGFDQRLQPGYQFFMQRLAEISDVLFALHYLGRDTLARPSPAFLRPEFSACVQGLQQLFAAILEALQHRREKNEAPDFSDQLLQLEKKIRQHVPEGPEWQDAREDWLRLTDVVCCLEDLRWMLLKLNEVMNPPQGRFQSVVRADLSQMENRSQRPIPPMIHRKENDWNG